MEIPNSSSWGAWSNYSLPNGYVVYATDQHVIYAPQIRKKTTAVSVKRVVFRLTFEHVQEKSYLSVKNVQNHFLK